MTCKKRCCGLPHLPQPTETSLFPSTPISPTLLPPCVWFMRVVFFTMSQVEAEYEPQFVKPPKGVLNWVGQPAPGRQPLTFQARLYDRLFNSEDPAGLGDEWLADINPESLQVKNGDNGDKKG